MNNELKYALNAVLLAVLFFASIQFASFILSIEERTVQKPVNEIVVENNMSSTENSNPKLSKGKTLFNSNCASCHAIHKNLTGPALAEIETRVPDKRLLYSWIRNNAEVLKSGNKYFTKLYKTYNGTQMNVFSNLTDEDIDAILFYIKAQSNVQVLPIASVQVGSF